MSSLFFAIEIEPQLVFACQPSHVLMHGMKEMEAVLFGDFSEATFFVQAQGSFIVGLSRDLDCFHLVVPSFIQNVTKETRPDSTAFFQYGDQVYLEYVVSFQSYAET